MSDIALSSATRANLLSLQRSQALINVTQVRLSTSLRVNSALDDAIAFFTSRNLSARASDLTAVKDTISGGVGVITAAVHGLEAIEAVLKQMQAVAQSAISSPASSTRAQLASQFNELRSQVDALAEDSSFDGINLLKSGTPAFVGGADQLTVRFNERAEANALNQLIVNGLRSADFSTMVADAVVPTGVAGTAGVWGQTGTTAITAINAAVRAIDSALVTVRTAAQSFGTSASALQLRMDYTSSMINTLSGGAAQLVNADLNEESANLLSLQTRQQLGTIALAIAQRSEQAVLRMF